MQVISTPGNSSSRPNPEKTLTKALRNVALLLDLKQATLAKILGVSTATVSRLFSGAYTLARERGKEWEMAVLLVRLFRSLDAMVGHDEHARQWLNGENTALGGRPADMLESVEGLVTVLHYVDAHRGRI
jgi:uncharacterized protein (DUF2384 family)